MRNHLPQGVIHMPMTGMDVDDVRNLSNLLTQKAQEVEQVRQQLTQKLTSVNWIGQDANRFKNDWSSRHVPALQQVCTALNDAARAANVNANEQVQTSS